MPDAKDGKPEWMDEFQKANTPSYPLTPHPMPAAGGSSPERRRHARFKVDEAPAELRIKGITYLLTRRMNSAREAIDISEGGARILSNERVPPGTRVRVKIDIGKFRDSIEGDAEIRWCRHGNASRQDYLLGLMFTKDDSERARKIGSMRGYFTSPQFQAAHEKRLKEKSSSFFPRT